jgi:hypothetical protein
VTQQSTTPTQDVPTAIEPQRVLVLNENEQHAILDAYLERFDHMAGAALALRIAEGEMFEDEMDELARTTLRKRRLETEIKRCNMRIEQLTEPVVERLAEIGARSLTHEGSSTRIQRDDQVYLKYAGEDWTKDEQALARVRAGETMAALGGEYAEFIQPTYNSSSVGAFFRERYKARLAAELDKPEHERRPVTPDDVIPDELREWLSLSVKPRVKVTAV